MTRSPPPRRGIRLAILLALLPAILATAAASLGAGAPARAAEAEPRIVSLGGAVTEILYDLGLGDRIAALDTTSVFPPEALATKPNVGYLRQLSAEGILSARPTLVLAVEGAGPPDALALVAQAGVTVASVPDEPTPEGVRRKIETVARLVGRAEGGARLAAEVDARMAALAAMRARLARPVRALFVLSLQNGRAMVGGRGTTADGMFALTGAENVAAAVEGYRPMTDEAIVAAAPDVVVMMDNGPGGRAPSDLLAGPALSRTPAGRDGRLVTMNGLYLLGYGPRTPDAARDLMRALHPELGRE